MATTPPWIVQSSSVGPSKAPSWVVSSIPTTTTGSSFDPFKEGAYEDAFKYLDGGINSDTIQNQGQFVGGEGGSYQDNFVDTRDHGKFTGMVDVSGRDYGGEAATGGGPKYQLNYEKMPNQGMTKVGRIDQVFKVDTLNDVINPNAVVWDDNYGWVTSKKNRKPTLGDKLGPAIASMAMGGLMGAALPAGVLTTGVKTAFNMAPSLASGKFNPVNAGLGLAGAFAPSMGVPSWVVPSVKTGIGLANMYNQGRG